MTKPIQIKNDEAARDIRELAAITGEPLTTAVAAAVREKLARVRRRSATEMEERRRAVNQLLAEIDALPRYGPPLTDDDLYDEYGLPK